MKKILILVLALSVLLLAACNGKPIGETGTGSENNIFDPDGNVVIDRPDDNTGSEQNVDAPRPSIPDGPANSGVMGEPEEEELPTQSQTPDETKPTTPDNTEPPQESAPSYQDLDYLQFHALTAAQQREVMESFESIEAFFDWYEQIQETYEKEHPSIEVDGPIDLDEIFGNK